jgi:hypothetical protein
MRNLRLEFVVFCVALVATIVSTLSLSGWVVAACWGALAGYALKAAVELAEGRGPR